MPASRLRTFLTKVPIPAEHVHPIYDPELDEAQGAAVYQALIEEIVRSRSTAFLPSISSFSAWGTTATPPRSSRSHPG